MTAGVLISGLIASFAGFFAALLAGQALHMALLSYSLAGLCGALTFILSMVTVWQRGAR